MEGDKIMTVTCDRCSDIVYVNMYFSNIGIREECVPFDFNKRYYAAFCSGKTICPKCGSDIFKIYSRPIDEEDIIKLAIGRK
jgi:hypothetical protein